jgi:hypothetical protein
MVMNRAPGDPEGLNASSGNRLDIKVYIRSGAVREVEPGRVGARRASVSERTNKHSGDGRFRAHDLMTAGRR